MSLIRKHGALLQAWACFKYRYSNLCDDNASTLHKDGRTEDLKVFVVSIFNAIFNQSINQASKQVYCTEPEDTLHDVHVQETYIISTKGNKKSELMLMRRATASV